jgi:hypothetical protein
MIKGQKQLDKTARPVSFSHTWVSNSGRFLDFLQSLALSKGYLDGGESKHFLPEHCPTLPSLNLHSGISIYQERAGC